MKELIRLENVSKSYRAAGREAPVLRGVGLSVGAGEFLAVVGPSGSGKSTLMNLLGCLDAPDEGRYWLAGRRMDRLGDRQLAGVRSREIGFVFQHFHLLPGLSARENVELPLEYRGLRAPERRRLAEEALEKVGMTDWAGHRPAQLSGGQQQRVAVARAVAGSPALLLADEPTGNLDPDSARAVLELFCRLHREGRTIILITHDGQLARLADRRVRVSAGKLMEERDVGEKENEKERPFADRGHFGAGAGGHRVDGLARPQ